MYKFLLYKDTIVGILLVSMYCKCGVLEDVRKLFMEMLRKDLVIWNFMIFGYAIYGVGEIVFVLFDRMRIEKIKLDWIIYVVVLLVCNYSGLVEFGMRYFDLMRVDYGIKVKFEYYSCMVDFLGRVGKFKEVIDMIEKMFFKLYVVIFGSFLGVFRVYKNIEVVEFVVNNLFSIDFINVVVYV